MGKQMSNNKRYLVNLSWLSPLMWGLLIFLFLGEPDVSDRIADTYWPKKEPCCKCEKITPKKKVEKPNTGFKKDDFFDD